MITFKNLPKTDTPQTIYIPEMLRPYLEDILRSEDIPYNSVSYDDLTFDMCQAIHVKDDKAFYQNHGCPVYTAALITTNIDRTAFQNETLKMFGNSMDPDFKVIWDKTHRTVFRSELDAQMKAYRNEKDEDDVK